VSAWRIARWIAREWERWTYSSRCIFGVRDLDGRIEDCHDASELTRGARCRESESHRSKCTAWCIGMWREREACTKEGDQARTLNTAARLLFDDDISLDLSHPYRILIIGGVCCFCFRLFIYRLHEGPMRIVSPTFWQCTLEARGLVGMIMPQCNATPNPRHNHAKHLDSRSRKGGREEEQEG